MFATRTHRLIGAVAWGLLGSLVVVAPGLAVETTVKHPAQLFAKAAPAYVEITRPRDLIGPLLHPAVREGIDALRDVSKAPVPEQLKKLGEVARALEAKLGQPAPQILEDLLGRGIYACFDPTTKGVVVAVRARDAERLEAILTAARELIDQAAADRGAESPVKSKEYRGHTGWSFAPEQTHVAIGDLLLVTNKSDALKAAIDRLEDDDGLNLAADAEFQEAQRHVGERPIVWAFGSLELLRLQPKVETFLRGGENSPLVELLLGGVLDAAAKSPSVVAVVDGENAPRRLRLILPTDHAATSERRAWYFPEATGPSMTFPLPSGTLATFDFQRDFAGLWGTREELFDDETNSGMTQAETNLGLFLSGRDFVSQVLGEFGSNWRVVVARQEFASDEPRPALKLPAVALVCELRDPAEFGPHLQLAFQNLVSVTNVDGVQKGRHQLLINMQSSAEVTLGTTRYVIDSPEEKAAGSVQLNVRPAYALVDKYFVLGTSGKLVEELAVAVRSEPSAAKVADNLRVEIHPAEIARALVDNADLLAGRLVLSDGRTREEAERRLAQGLEIVEGLGPIRIRLAREKSALVFEIDYAP